MMATNYCVVVSEPDCRFLEQLLESPIPDVLFDSAPVHHPQVYRELQTEGMLKHFGTLFVFSDRSYENLRL